MVSVLYSITAFFCFWVVFCLSVRVGRYVNKENAVDRAGLLMLVWTAVFCAIDMAWGIFASAYVMNDTLLFMFSTLFHVGAALTPMIGANVVLNYFSDAKDPATRMTRIVLAILAVFELALLGANCFKHFMFNVNDVGEYISTSYRYVLFYCQYASYLCIGAFSIAKNVLKRKETEREGKDIFFFDKNRTVVLGFVTIPLITGYLQMLFADAATYSIGYTLGCCCVCLFVAPRVKKKNRIAFGAAVVTSLMMVVVIVYLMKNSIGKSEYLEQKELLRRISESNANLVIDNVKYAQYMIQVVSDDISHDYSRLESLDTYFEDFCSREAIANQTLFFVDTQGVFYSSQKQTGMIKDASYYKDDSPDTLYYISAGLHHDYGDKCLVVRDRLKNTIPVETGQGSKTLSYVGMIYDISRIDKAINESFAGENDIVVYNSKTGEIQYKDTGLNVLKAENNLYEELDHFLFLFDESSKKVQECCNGDETTVAEFESGGKKYFFCSSPIVPGERAIAFVITQKDMDEISSDAIRVIVSYISFIAIILGTVTLLMIVFVIRNSMSQRSLQRISELNVELEKATNAKSEFLSNMTHDIRTPLNGIMGMTMIAKKVEGNPEKTVECLDRIEVASEHLLSLVNDVLDMSRIEYGKTEIVNEETDIRMLADNCQSIIQGQMEGREISLETSIECEHPFVMADDLHLRQILFNILGNAVKFTKDGGNIWFRIREKEYKEGIVLVSFEIEDTGIGMNKEYLEKIFEPFSQDDAGARSNYKGTGLGMVITKKLTELMGGTIEVDSELGVGSKFVVTIPFEVSTTKEYEKEAYQGATDLEGVKILIVEDNELNMDIAMELLEDAGAILTPAVDGQEAVDAFTDNPPGTFDVILMDIMLPVLTGLEATKKIRAMERADAKTIPIIAMTANAYASDVQATRDAGMNAHLSKPIDIQKVISVVAMFAGK